MNHPDTLTPAAPAAEPAFLARARRILGGDVRPDDYLPVTPEVRRRVDLFLEWARARGNGMPLAPGVEARQERVETLSFHHGGENIVYIEDERGIIVLAVGLDRGTDLFREFHGRTPHTLVDAVPFPTA
ncbi:MAG: hypothetical protein C0501_09555 [Isosphaera sp.]|nr:hypothetical protein [Isosphaera sp.]